MFTRVPLLGLEGLILAAEDPFLIGKSCKIIYENPDKSVVGLLDNGSRYRLRRYLLWDQVSGRLYNSSRRVLVRRKVFTRAYYSHIS